MNITDQQIDAALALHPWPDRPSVKYARQLAKALGVAPRRGCWKIQCAGRRRLVERVIERATTGDPAGAAWRLATLCGSSRDWAERVIERAMTGDALTAAWLMATYGGSCPYWLEKVLRRREPA